MRYRKLGPTGLEVSVVGYGASPLGGVFRNVEENDGIRAVRTALDLGVNIIDVSPYYGATVAESVLGRALHGVDRSSYVLATKVGRYGEEQFDFSAQQVVRSVDESLARLGVEYVDLIQCHDIEFGDLNQIVNETLPTLRTLRDAGKVRFVGVTGYPLPALGYVAERAEIDTVLTYCRYTLADQELTRWLPLFDRLGRVGLRARRRPAGRRRMDGAMSEAIAAALGRDRILPVVVIDDAAAAADLAAALAAGGQRFAEVTFRTPRAGQALAAMAGHPDLTVGAGTVISTEQVDVAIDSGARFAVSPGLDNDVIEHCQNSGLPVFPGVATATDIQPALRHGLDTVKLFPAEALGGLPLVSALAAPFPGLTFIPTGGIGADNAPAYLRHPAVLAVGGSWMAPPGRVQAGDWDAVAMLAAQARALADDHDHDRDR